VSGPFYVLTIALFSGHDVKVEVKYVLLGFRSGTVDDLNVVDP
jgi:hypothetical protein